MAIKLAILTESATKERGPDPHYYEAGLICPDDIEKALAGLPVRKAFPREFAKDSCGLGSMLVPDRFLAHSNWLLSRWTRRRARFLSTRSTRTWLIMKSRLGSCSQSNRPAS